MNTSITSKTIDKTITNKLLTSVVIFMLLPLFLEFGITLPLLALHLLGGEMFQVLAGTISVTGILAAILGLSTTTWFLLNRSRITSAKTRSLGNTIIGISVAYALIIGAIAAIYATMLNNLS